MNQREIFSAAVQITDPVGRAAYLDQACGGDANLRRRVEALLHAHDSAGDFLARPAVEQLADDLSPPAPDAKEAEPHETEANEDLTFLKPSRKPGSLGRLGHYEVFEVLGRGGFATVV